MHLYMMDRYALIYMMDRYALIYMMDRYALIYMRIDIKVCICGFPSLELSLDQ